VQKSNEEFYSEISCYHESELLPKFHLIFSRSYESYYIQAQRVRRLVLNDFNKNFSHGVCDVILTPTCTSVAFPIAQHMNPVDNYLNDVFTVPSSLAGRLVKFSVKIEWLY
jgi:Asp-tRNA(Asn)/Glu-tRNA(Gln) amidotransferase A subunit family amidase